MKKRIESIEHCEKTKKYCYSSESKAFKAVIKYTEIKRCYYCYHCESWHTTSNEGVTDEGGSNVTTDMIKKELDKLNNRL